MMHWLLVVTALLASLAIGCSSHGDKGGAGMSGAQAATSGQGSGGAQPGTGGHGGGGLPGGSGGRSGAGGAGGAMASHMDASVSMPADAALDQDAALDHDASDAASPDAGVYSPCPPASGVPCAIMPLGDSITFGQGSTTGGGYRDLLFHLAHADGKSLTFVGAGQSGPTMVDGVAFSNQHEGYSGFTIGDDASLSTGIKQLIPAEMITYAPDVVTLMIGTNDITLQVDLPNAPTRLGVVMDEILAPDPDVLLLVAQIVPTQLDEQNELVQAFNAGIPALVQARVAAGKHVVMVDMYGAFVSHADYKTALLADFVHPNDAGYQVMAETWYAALESVLH